MKDKEPTRHVTGPVIDALLHCETCDENLGTIDLVTCEAEAIAHTLSQCVVILKERIESLARQLELCYDD